MKNALAPVSRFPEAQAIFSAKRLIAGGILPRQGFGIKDVKASGQRGSDAQPIYELHIFGKTFIIKAKKSEYGDSENSGSRTIIY